MKNTILILFFHLFITYNLNAQSREVNLLSNIPLKEHFNSNNYNGGIQSWAFDQDSTGILYVANNKGILEFDGKEWKTYSVPLSTRLRAVKVDKNNRIFVGGQGQIGFFEKNENGLKFNSLLKHLPTNKPAISETWKILEFDNKIIFNTESELYVFENNTIKPLTLPGYMRYAFKVKNRMFAQFYGQGLYEIINNKFISIKNTTINHDIVAILPNGDGYYCITREGEVYKLNDSGLSPIKTPVNLGTVNDALKLKSGKYAIGTQSNGLFIFSSNFALKRHLTKRKGLSGRTVKSLYEDEFQNLWVALNIGIDYLKLSLPFSLVNEEIGVEGTGYAAIKHKGAVLLGTNNGVFTEKPLHTKAKNFPFEMLQESNGQVYNFSKINNEIIINHNRGAFQLAKKGLTQIQDIGSWQLIETKDPKLVFESGYRGISFLTNKNNQWKKTGNISNLDESLATIILKNDSTLWSSHISKGAYKIDLSSNLKKQKKITQYGEKDGFPSNIKIKVYNLNNKLIFTSEKGIYDFNDDTETFTPNTYFNNLLGLEHISHIVSNKNNSAIYYIQNQKLGSLTQKSFGTFEKETNTFKHVNKLINDDITNITILDNKNILIGAKQGFIHYNPKKKLDIKSNFNVLFRSIEIYSSKDSIKKHIRPQEENLKISESQSINFRFAAPYFDGFENLKYSYRLTPLNSQWSQWSNSNEKEYTHLPPGIYTMQIKALNIYNTESNVTSFSFEISTPWYATSWAKLGYVLILLLSLILFPFIQRIRFRKEKSIIYESKAEEIKIKDEEINKLENDKLKTEIDLKNDQLTSITMQLVKNNDFILTIQNNIADSINLTTPKKELKKIIKNIDRELSNNDSWNKFAYHFDQVHGNYLKKLSENNIKLSPREIKLAAFLRMNMSSKEIATMLNITVRGVELARYRLRKKLNLERDQNLVEHLIELDNS